MSITFNGNDIISSTNVAYATCSTAAATAEKEVKVQNNTNWQLKSGSILVVSFSTTNTAQNPTIKVGNNDAKSVYYSGNTITTANLNKAGCAGRPVLYMYNGTYFVFLGWAYEQDTTYSTFGKSGSTAKSGLVPAPSTTAGTTKYLREDGTWVVPPDTKYSHPTTEGYKHIPSGGSSGNILEWTSSGTATWVEPNYLSKSNPTGTGAFSINRKSDSTIGTNSVALGNDTTASESYSFASGNITTASGYGSVAEGYNTTASGSYSHASGYNTTALNYQFVLGHYNTDSTGSEGKASGTEGTAFVVGNGVPGAGSNAFRVTYSGAVFGKAAYASGGADYAEYFEWSDGNPNKEDRVGYFVTIDEDDPEKIRIANEGDYILGIVSGKPCIIGNGDEDWQKRYILDDFGRYIEETFEYEEAIIDEETGEESTVTKTGIKWKENPEYDPEKQYIQREDRPEWSAVGMVGVLSVYDDGTCKVNSYCKCSNDGIATAASERGIDTYRVIKRVSDNIIKVIIKP